MLIYWPILCVAKNTSVSEIFSMVPDYYRHSSDLQITNQPAAYIENELCHYSYPARAELRYQEGWYVTRDGRDEPSLLGATNYQSRLTESLIFVLIGSLLMLHLDELLNWRNPWPNYLATANGIYQVFVNTRICSDLLCASNSSFLSHFN